MDGDERCLGFLAVKEGFECEKKGEGGGGEERGRKGAGGARQAQLAFGGPVPGRNVLCWLAPALLCVLFLVCFTHRPGVRCFYWRSAGPLAQLGCRVTTRFHRSVRFRSVPFALRHLAVGDVNK